MNAYIRLLLKVVLSLMFAGFVIPLWMAHDTSLSAIYQITGMHQMAHSFPYESASRDFAKIGYVWCGCSMLWLFWYVTRKAKNVAEQGAASDR